MVMGMSTAPFAMYLVPSLLPVLNKKYVLITFSLVLARVGFNFEWEKWHVTMWCIKKLPFQTKQMENWKAFDGRDEND